MAPRLNWAAKHSAAGRSLGWSWRASPIATDYESIGPSVGCLRAPPLSQVDLLDRSLGDGILAHILRLDLYSSKTLARIANQGLLTPLSM